MTLPASRVDAVELHQSRATTSTPLVEQGIDLAWGPRPQHQTADSNIRLAMGENFGVNDWASIYKNMFGYDLLAQPPGVQQQKIRQLYRYLNGYHPGE